MAEIGDNNKSNPEIVEQPAEIDKDNDNNPTKSSTITSKDQLICKSPQNSIKTKKRGNTDKKTNNYDNYLIYTGLFQILFGVLMVTFGVLTIINDASLSQIGGGIWGGFFATINGFIGVLASARGCCLLKPTVQRIAHTVYLALSLVCLATSQLIVAISAIGLGRDFNNLVHTMMAADRDDDLILTTTTTQLPSITSGTIFITLPVNYPILLYNIGLVIVASLECLIATITSYKSSKLLCPCFQQQQQRYNKDGTATRTTQDDNAYRQAFVSNWLGKHNSPPTQLFVVATATPPSSLGKTNKLEVPLFALPVPPPVTAVPPLITYPLIPAPLGTIPPPPPPSKRDILYHQRRYLAKLHAEQYYRRGSKSDISNSSAKSRSKSTNTNDNNNNSNNKNDKLSDMDVAKTYTGLDKTIAEEFIDICDSRHNSLCGDSSCTSSTNSSSSNTTNSDLSSGDYLVNTKI